MPNSIHPPQLPRVVKTTAPTTVTAASTTIVHETLVPTTLPSPPAPPMLASWHAGDSAVLPLMCTCHAASTRR
ncbi:hypothetical protein BJF77_03755 [Kocuria sp. CNJ-770]|nr:hypothetical protein BJF77_03755 [Kocuria sp. CNJ-770]